MATREVQHDAETRVLPSVCPLDCPDTCSLSVTVKGNRIVDVRGSKANPFTSGSICSKVAKSYPDFVHGANRLRHPLLRTGARGSDDFACISWDEALDRVHAGLSESIARYGGESVVPFNYSGPHGKLAGGSMDRRFFHRIGASQIDRGPLCAGIRGRAFHSLYGDVPGMPAGDVEHAQIIVVWGVNITVSSLHMQRQIQRARKRGAKLVVIDPKRTKVAEQADLHLAIRPGTDVLLARAVAAELERNGGMDREFIERWVLGADVFLQRARSDSLDWIADKCGIEVADITRFARWYQKRSPAAMMIGVAVERNRNGGAGIRAAASLPALAGKFGVRGGGIVFGSGAMFPGSEARLQRPDLQPQSTRTLNILDVPRHILDGDLDPPIGALFIYNHNPVAVHPDQSRMRRALASESVFTVGCDVVMTDSMRYADVILPACSHFEHDDIFAAYGTHYLQRAEAVISAVGEALPNTAIFRKLAARFGFDEAAFNASDTALMNEAFDTDDVRLSGVEPAQLPLDTALPMLIEGRPRVLFENIMPATTSGKVELFSNALEAAYGEGLPGYRDCPVQSESDFPLTLITPGSDKRSNATFGGSPQSEGIEWIEMHSSDAVSRGLNDGERVRVWNDLGEVALSLRVSDSVRPGVVCSPKGTWLCSSPTRQTVNALIPDARSDIADGACYNDTRIEVALL